MVSAISLTTEARVGTPLCGRLIAGFALFATLMLATVSAALAQTNTATINGTVTDQSGAAVPGATVTATNTKTGISQSQAADASGRYVMPNLDPGIYDVQVAQSGFATTIRKAQELLVGKAATIDFALQVSTLAQTVEVTTAAPVIDVSQDVLSRIVETKEIDNLPLISRSFASLSQLSPGVQVNPAGTTIQFGASANWANNYIVDGFSTEMFNNGLQIISFAQDWIQEFSVVTEQATAEYSLSSAGFINAVTRSGGNDMHGRVYGYFQDAVLNAKPSFLPAKAPQKPSYNQERPGGFLGGAIKKDKLFYFVGFEYLHLLTGVPVNIPAAFTAPGATSGVFPQGTRSDFGMLKVDYKINSADTVHVRMNEEYDTLTNAGISVTQPQGFGTHSRHNAQDYLVTWDDVLSPNTVNVVAVNYYSQYIHSVCNDINILGPYTGGGPLATPWGDPTGWYASVSYSGAGVTTGCTSLFGGQGERNWLLSDSLTFSKGAHEIKVGVDAGHRNQYDRSVVRLSDGSYTMAGNLAVPFVASQPYAAATGVVTSSPCGTYTGTCTGFPLSYSIEGEFGNIINHDGPSPYFGMFAQDSWKVTSRLTLNLGVRYDYEFTNGNIQTLPVLNPIHNDSTDLSPRAGFAWTPFSDKRTVLRGGFGIYYDLSHAVAGNYLANTLIPTYLSNFNATSTALNPYCYGNTTCATAVPAADVQAVQEELAYALANYTLPVFPTTTPAVISLGGRSYTIPVLPAAAIVNPPDQYGSFPASVLNFPSNFKNPATLQTTMGAAHQFGEGWGASADFVYSHGYNQVLIVNKNLNPATFQPIIPQFSSVYTFVNDGFFNEYSLRASAHYNSHRGDEFQLAYTYTDSHDNDPVAGGWSFVSTAVEATDPFNLSVDYGRSPVSAHNLNASGVIQLPVGIKLSPIVSFQTGVPYNATTTLRPNSATVPNGAGTFTNCPAFYSQCYPLGYTKNSLTGSDIFTLATRVSKTFKFKERYSATILFEGFNLTNRVNYTSFQANVQSTTFMQPTGAGPRRQLQGGFEFDF